jgi:hypothetical protein
VQIVANLMGAGNGEGGSLCDLFEVIARDTTGEDHEPCVDCDLNAAQLCVTGRAQGVLDPLREVEILAINR